MGDGQRATPAPDGATQVVVFATTGDEIACTFGDKIQGTRTFGFSGIPGVERFHLVRRDGSSVEIDGPVWFVC